MTRTNLVHPVSLMLVVALVGCAGEEPSVSLDKANVPARLADALAPTLTTVGSLNGAIEDTPFTITYDTLFGASDAADPDGDPISFRLLGVLAGTVTNESGSELGDGAILSSGVSWIYTPPANDSGNINAFEVVAQANGETSDTTVTVVVAVTPVNDAPVATAATYQAVAGSSLSFVLSATDADHNESDLTYEVLTEPSQGVYNFSGRASVSYTPNANTETDSLVFRAVDPDGAASESATITINVTTLNSNPSASDAEMTVQEDSANNEVELTLTDPDNDQIFVVELVEAPTNGTATFVANIAKYTPDADFFGTETYTYRVQDERGAYSDPATITVTVNPVADAPRQLDGIANGTEEQELAFSMGLFVGDPDDPADALAGLSFELALDSENGAVSISGTDATFTPDENFFGTTTFLFNVTDGQFPRTFIGTISLANVDDPPFIAGALRTVDEDNILDFAVSIGEVDGDDFQLTMLTGPTDGVVEQLERNLFRFTPPQDYFGTQTLEFKIQDIGTDNLYESGAGNLILQVDPINDPPVANPPADLQIVNEDESIDVTVPATDVDSDASELSILNGPSDQGGLCTFLSADPLVLRYQPSIHYSGFDRCPFYVTDGIDLGIIKVIEFQILATPDAPYAINQNVRVSDTLGYTFTLNAGDYDGDTITPTVQNAPSNGTLTIDGLNATYTPANTSVYNDTFTYFVSDGSLQSTIATVSIINGDDSDGDDILDPLDNCDFIANVDQADQDEDGIGDVCDSDVDGDGVDNDSDNCPLQSNSLQADLDNDNIGDNCDEDIDGDGIDNTIEDAIGTNRFLFDSDGDTINDGLEFGPDAEARDTDEDGTIDALDTDSDSDGYGDVEEAGSIDEIPFPRDTDDDDLPDYRDLDSDGDEVQDEIDNCYLISNTDQADFDADTIGDVCDTDRDGDGVANDSDTCPDRPDPFQIDRDDDGIGDLCDDDLDGDGVLNDEDNCMYVANADQLDSDDDDRGDVCDSDQDGDGIPDINDNCPSIVNADQANNDADGAGDVCDADDDNDGVLDVSDNCALLANSGQEDSDQDGIGDLCDLDGDGDGFDDKDDNCPAISNISQADADFDGIGDVCDDDDDNDGIPDSEDGCPQTYDPLDIDTDGDGTGDACDDDDDNDTIPDTDDNCVLVENTDQANADGDTYGDVCDADDDGDGISDDQDNCPFDANPNQSDIDSDGTGDLCDDDIDGDGIANDQDNCPNVANADQADLDDDGVGDVCSGDQDGDGIPDGEDNCPELPNPTQIDGDDDGIGKACDDDEQDGCEGGCAGGSPLGIHALLAFMALQRIVRRRRQR